MILTEKFNAIVLACPDTWDGPPLRIQPPENLPRGKAMMLVSIAEGKSGPWEDR
jgi:hypothetical protein